MTSDLTISSVLANLDMAIGLSEMAHSRTQAVRNSGQQSNVNAVHLQLVSVYIKQIRDIMETVKDRLEADL